MRGKAECRILFTESRKYKMQRAVEVTRMRPARTILPFSQATDGVRNPQTSGTTMGRPCFRKAPTTLPV